MWILWFTVSLWLRLLWPFLVVWRRLWDWVVSRLLGVAMATRPRSKHPPIFNPLLLLPATELAQRIRDRKLTCVEVVRAFMTRCSDANPIVNAIVQENFGEAMRAARRADERINAGYRDGTLSPEKLQKEEPFLGMPFTVKETIAAEGFAQTAGLLSRAETVAERDATVVSNMKKAGAILLATTNVSELGMWWECANPLYGRTNNPYDPRRSPGGSSGGEAALMGCCGSPISMGSDTGGSIRTPAFFCGLFAHKPTIGVVPVSGCSFLKEADDIVGLQAVGPITRHACDIAPILKVLAGDKVGVLKLDEPVHLSSIKFYSMEDDGNRVITSSVCEPIKKAQRDIATHLMQKYDLDVNKVKIIEFAQAFWIWQERMASDYSVNGPMHRRLVNNEGELNIWTEMLRAVLGRARYSFASLLQVVIEKTTDELQFLWEQKQQFLEGKTTQKATNNPGWRQLKVKIQRLLGEDGVLLFPPHPTLAPFHRESYLKPFNFVYAAIFNALGFPVTQVPLGLDPASGLPLGIQVVGGMYMDRLTIAVASELEEAFGGWKCPAKII